MKISELENFCREFRQQRKMDGAMRGRPYKSDEEVKADKPVSIEFMREICHLFGDVAPKRELDGRCLSFEVFGVRFFAAAAEVKA